MMEVNLLDANAFSKYAIHNFGVKLRFSVYFHALDEATDCLYTFYG